ncbi:MAG: hypothetical protein ACXQT5_04495 [Candidatus Syntropharchaeia archaeon]
MKKYRERILAEKNYIYDAFPVWIETYYLQRSLEFQVPVFRKEEADSSGRKEKVPEIPSNGKIPTESVQTGPAPTPGGGKEIGFFVESGITIPSKLSPPMPFGSILISFLFIFPLYFVSQLYSSSMMEERVSRRCELLLASPVKRWECASP